MMNKTCLYELTRLASRICSEAGFDTAWPCNHTQEFCAENSHPRNWTCDQSPEKIKSDGCPREFPREWLPRDASWATFAAHLRYTASGPEFVVSVVLVLGIWIVLSGSNVLSLLVYRRLHRAGEPVYAGQVGVCILDLLMTTAGALLLFVVEILSLDSPSVGCWSTALFFPVPVMYVATFSLTLGGLLVQLGICVDRLQAILRPLDYKVANKRWRIPGLFAASYAGSTMFCAIFTRQKRLTADSNFAHIESRKEQRARFRLAASPLQYRLCDNLCYYSARFGFWDGLGPEEIAESLALEPWQSQDTLLRYYCKGYFDGGLLTVFYAVSGVVALLLLVATIALVLALKAQKSEKKGKSWATKKQEIKHAKNKRVQNILVILEAVLQLLQVVVGVTGQWLWTVNTELANVSDFVLYMIIIIQLSSNFLFAPILSALFRAEIKRLLGCA